MSIESVRARRRSRTLSAPRHVVLAASVFLLLAGVNHVRLRSSTGAQSPAASTLTGQIVDETTGQGVPNLQVGVRCTAVPGGTAVAQQVQADREGQFISRVDPGECRVIVNLTPATGYATPVAEIARPYDVGAGETVHVVRRIARLSSVEGRVTDERGGAVEGITVFLQQRRPLAGVVQWAFGGLRAQTDAAGRFRFPTMAVGTYRFVVPALESVASVPAFSVAAGTARTGVELRARIRPTFQVSGVVEVSAQAGPNVAVSLDDGESPVDLPLTVAEVQADADGRFVFPRVPQSAYRVRVDTSPRMPGATASAVHWAREVVSVTADVDVVLTLKLAPRIHGELRFSDPPGPAQRALLAFDSASGRAASVIVRADAGQFITGGLIPDQYVVRSAGIPAGWRVKSVTVAGRDVSDEPLDLSAGSIDDVVVTFTDRLTNVTGIVRDAQGHADGAATVLAFSTNSTLWSRRGDSPWRVQQALTSQKGRYTVVGLPPGEYFLAAVSSGELPQVPGASYDAQWLQRLAATAVRLNLQEGARVVSDLQRSVVR